MRTLGYAIAVALSATAGVAGAWRTGHVKPSIAAHTQPVAQPEPQGNYVLLAPGDSYSAGPGLAFLRNAALFPTRPIRLHEGAAVQTGGQRLGPTMIIFVGGRTLTVLPHSRVRIDHLAEMPVAENSVPHRAMRFAGAGALQGTTPTPGSNATVEDGAVVLGGGPPPPVPPKPPQPEVVLGTKGSTTVSHGSTIVRVVYKGPIGVATISIFEGAPVSVNTPHHKGLELQAGQQVVISRTGVETVVSLPPNHLVP